MRLSGLILTLLLLVIGSHAAAQDNQEPVLYVQAREGGQSGSMSWSCTGQEEYRLCTHWDGPWHGMAAKDLFRLRRSVLGLKPGERLQFYRFSHASESTGKEGGEVTHASTKSLGAGSYVNTYGNTRWHDIYPPHFTPPSAEADAELIRTATGARLVLKGVPCPHVGDAPFHVLGIDNLKITEAEKARLYTVELSEAELASWGQLTKTLARSFQAKEEFEGSVSYSATITTTLPDLGEVDVEIVGYEQWLPEGNWQDPASPGNRLRIKARVKAIGNGTTLTKARFTFKLESSKERGVCLNWPMQGASQEEDLQFRKEDNPNLDPSISPTEAKTRDLVDRTEAVIACFDYGAHGKLKVTAEDKDGKPLKVTFHGQDKATIAIPKSEEGGHIADAWKAAKGATGLTDTWDEAVIPLQDATGDGMQLYAKYRGVVVLEGGARKYLRLPPREKAHFVADPAGVFDSQRWFATSGIRAYRLDESLYYVGSRFVDFNGPCTKYAVRLEVDDSLTGPAEQYAMTDEVGSPKIANTVKLFRGRMNAMLGRVIARVQKAVSSPDSTEGAEEAALLQNTCGISLQEAAAALKRMDQGQLLERLIRLAAIHEMGHACGILNGHTKAVVRDGQVEYEETEQQVGDVLCPMQYLDQVGRRRFVLLGLLGGSGTFCKDGFDCFRQLTVK